ncbi:MAG: hypothetical protein GX129_04410 [Clostridiales bacterium]|jgi:hypothetical protein|nr:hypothetical protein [Clostridiales bacterium]
MKPNKIIHKKFSFIDAIIAIISLAALAALIFIVKYTNTQIRMEHELLAKAKNNNQFMKSDDPLYEMIEYLVFNEINQGGWIELYNIDRNTGIELSGCYIAVNGKNQYTFDDTDVINAGEFLCIEGIGKLGSSEHDIIGIYDENGNNLKNIMIPGLEKEESYGCLMEGDISYDYLTASKGISNSESERIDKDQLTFLVPGGFYDESFDLMLTAPEGSTIYYTLDGTKPSNQSNIYTEPILIENKSGSNMKYAKADGIDYIGSYRPSSISIGMVVRAVAIDPNGISSEVKSQSYFIGFKNASDLKNIPVLSITTEPDLLFDYFEGIYVTGRSHEDALARGEDGKESANYLNNWEREVFVEYFDAQKEKTYEGMMSIRIIQDLSISLPQKSLLLKAKGGGFPGSGLRNYFNDISNSLTLQTNRTDNSFKIREYLAGKLLANTTVGTPYIMPCNVFIDGEYWGGYMLRAEYDEAYINKRFGIDESNVLIAKDSRITNIPNYQQEYTELLEFIINNDLKDEENYAWIEEHMDIENYLEYFCANMFLANAEYGEDSLVMWRTINEQGRGFEDGRWRFLMPRLDNSMKNEVAGKLASSSINTFLQTGVTEDVYFQSLIGNEKFKELLDKVMTKMVEECFNYEQVDKEINMIFEQMKRMVESSYKRYFGYPSDFFYTTEIDKIRSFFQERSRFILLYTEEVMSWGGISNVRDDGISE